MWDGATVIGSVSKTKTRHNIVFVFFFSNPADTSNIHQDAPEWYRKVETGAEVFMSAWSTKRVNETTPATRRNFSLLCRLSSHDVDLNAAEE